MSDDYQCVESGGPDRAGLVLDAAFDVTERLSGAVWGHLVGDAMGVPYEFGPPVLPADVEWGHQASYRPQPPGTWSDDGGLMLALLDSLVDAGFDPADQGRRALEWWQGDGYKPGPVFDIGLITRESLDRFRSGTPAELAGGADEHQNGNGSLMRILPVALTGMAASDVELIDMAMRASALTHRHPRARVTCAVYVLTARELLRGERDRGAALDRSFHSVAAHIGDAEKTELGIIANYKNRSGSGYVVDCFWSAWDAFALSDCFEDTIRNAISHGDDADTTAAVAGGLAGAYWGVSSIPSQWLANMRGVEIVNAILRKLLITLNPAGSLE